MFLVDCGREFCGLPDFLVAGVLALQVVDGAVAFDDVVERETGLLKMTVNIAGKNECATIKMPSNGAKQLVSLVRRCAAIQVQSVSVESPREFWVAGKSVWAGNIGKADV